MKRRAFKVRWRDEPGADDYSAAEDYLSLLFEPVFARGAVKKLRKAQLRKFEAKDILRACGDPPEMAHIEEECDEIQKGVRQSPLLLMRHPNNERVVVADGFHRLCAVFRLDTKATIPCKIS